MELCLIDNDDSKIKFKGMLPSESRRISLRKHGQRRRKPRRSVQGAVHRQFGKPDIFPTTIASCSSGQKVDLT